MIMNDANFDSQLVLFFLCCKFGWVIESLCFSLFSLKLNMHVEDIEKKYRCLKSFSDCYATVCNYIPVKQTVRNLSSVIFYYTSIMHRLYIILQIVK